VLCAAAHNAYLPIADGSNLYLATVIDCFSRRLAGWAIAEHMRTDLVTAALAAARTRGLAGWGHLPLRLSRPPD
jgi:transposase InsO family protein